MVKELRDHFPWVSHISAHLVSRCMTAFPLGYLFKDVWWTAMENRDSVPPEQRTGLLTVLYNKDNAIIHSKSKADLLSIRKDLGTLSPGLPSWDPLCVQVSRGPFHTTPGDWDLRTGVNADTLATIAMSNQVLCLWLRSLVSFASIHQTSYFESRLKFQTLNISIQSIFSI